MHFGAGVSTRASTAHKSQSRAHSAHDLRTGLLESSQASLLEGGQFVINGQLPFSSERSCVCVCVCVCVW